MTVSPSSTDNSIDDGQELTHSDALPTGTKLSEFEITGLLGVGGFGMVYSAYDHSLHRTVAIKEYMPSALAGRAANLALASRSPVDQNAVKAGLTFFVSEARLLAQFDHPSLVKVYRFWEANNTAYMVMPLYRGLTLKEARSRVQSPPPEAWLRAMLWSILGALKYLHDHKTVHRDISPDNIFLQEVGPPVLLDLGAARRAISDRSQKHTAILKVNYAPIEQYADAADAVDMAQGAWTDLYSLAAVVHGCLCNAPPMPATFRAVRDRLPPIASVTKTVEALFGLSYSARFEQAIAHALAIKPGERPQTVQAFIDEMGLTASEGVTAVSWYDGLLAGPGEIPTADPQAKTILQTSAVKAANIDGQSTADVAIDVPAPNPAPMMRISAYGVLFQESQLLVSDGVPDMPHLAADGAPNGAGAGGQSQAKKGGQTRKWAVMAAGALALVVGAGIWLAGGSRGTPTTTPAPKLSATSATPSSTLSATLPGVPASATLPVAATATSATAPSTAQTVPKATATATAAKKEPTVAQKAEPAKSPAAPASSAAAAAAKKPAVAAIKPGAAADKARKGESAALAKPSTTEVRAETPAVPAVPAVSPAPVAQVAAAAPAPQKATGPVEICADRNFLLRSTCIFRECEKPEFTQLAFCVDYRRRLQENARSPER